MNVRGRIGTEGNTMAVSLEHTFAHEAQEVLRQCVRERKTKMAVSHQISLVIQDEDENKPEGAIGVLPVPSDLVEKLAGKVVFLVSNGHDEPPSPQTS